MLEQLEARILFSADLFSTLLDSEDKSESDTEELDSLLEDSTAITGALDKNRIDERKENSSISAPAPSAPTAVDDSFSGGQVEATNTSSPSQIPAPAFNQSRPQLQAKCNLEMD